MEHLLSAPEPRQKEKVSPSTPISPVAFGTPYKPGLATSQVVASTLNMGCSARGDYSHTSERNTRLRGRSLTCIRFSTRSADTERLNNTRLRLAAVAVWFLVCGSWCLPCASSKRVRDESCSERPTCCSLPRKVIKAFVLLALTHKSTSVATHHCHVRPKAPERAESDWRPLLASPNVEQHRASHHDLHGGIVWRKTLQYY
ncbi:hypothetical protein IF1G_11379 [Cordyceps javanica]|uniref:Uncharacterized protein n=1 Tax=Cordyceps javanica TaxID=43265 RepID=A0A545UKG6_9HYPO|nr:hypothetical protein IF1G_11379 [Cordyceps javanica]